MEGIEKSASPIADRVIVQINEYRSKRIEAAIRRFPKNLTEASRQFAHTFSKAKCSAYALSKSLKRLNKSLT